MSFSLFSFSAEWRDAQDEDVCYFTYKYENNQITGFLSLLAQTHAAPKTKRFEFTAYKAYEMIVRVYVGREAEIEEHVSLHGFSMGVHIAAMVGRYLQEQILRTILFLFGKYQVFFQFLSLLLITLNIAHLAWDPAGVTLFIGNRMMKPTDAKHIFAVHSASAMLQAGTSRLFGHVDIFIRNFTSKNQQHHVPSFLHRLTSAKEMKIYAEHARTDGNQPHGRVTTADTPTNTQPNECIYGVDWKGVPATGVFFLDFNHIEELRALTERIPEGSYRQTSWWETMVSWWQSVTGARDHTGYQPLSGTEEAGIDPELDSIV